MSWFRKYRPNQIKDLHLVNVRHTFLAMMESAKIPQAMLFAGPKGTGKTTSSRIIGALLNDPKNAKLVDYVYFGKTKPKKLRFVEPDYGNKLNQAIFDGHSYIVTELDAASNRGIDDIRSLQEKASLPPQLGKMSVYILDEAHMLTKEAFNAFLKLLEEPPPHVVFILATTELHKIPPTIVSRCSTVYFQKASYDEIKQALLNVIKSEKIDYDQKVLDSLIMQSDGSFRDAVKFLEMVCESGHKLTQERVEQILGGSTLTEIKSLIDAVLAKDAPQVAKLIQSLRSRGVNQKFFYESFFNFLHQDLLKSLEVATGKAYLDIKVAKFLLKYLLDNDLNKDCPIDFLSLELALIELVDRAQNKKNNSSSGNNTSSNVKTQKAEDRLSQDKDQSNAKQNVEIDKSIDSIAGHIDDSDELVYDYVNSNILFAQWDEFLNKVAETNFSLATLLKSSQPLKDASNGTAKINVYYRFHQEQLTQPKFMEIIENICEELFGARIRFQFLLAEAPRTAELAETQKEDKLAQLAEEVLM